MENKLVIAITGLPTSGKTSLGKALAEALGIHFVDIDAGPSLCGPPQEMDPHATDEKLTREQKRMRVAYTVLHAAVESNLDQGFPLVVCATYSRHGSQEFLRKAVEGKGGVLKVILCKYDDTPEEIDRRIAERLRTGATGGCRSTKHYLTDRDRFEGINLPHMIVQMDGADGVKNAVAQIIEYLK